MKVTVKRVFFDEKGLHKIGDVIEVEQFNADIMELIEEKKTEKKTKAK